MADLDVVSQGDILDLNTIFRDQHIGLQLRVLRSSLLGVPLAEELDFLAELGDVLGEGGGGHFECVGGPCCEKRLATTSSELVFVLVVYTQNQGLEAPEIAGYCTVSRQGNPMSDFAHSPYLLLTAQHRLQPRFSLPPR